MINRLTALAFAFSSLAAPSLGAKAADLYDGYGAPYARSVAPMVVERHVVEQPIERRVIVERPLPQRYVVERPVERRVVIERRVIERPIAEVPVSREIVLDHPIPPRPILRRVERDVMYAPPAARQVVIDPGVDEYE